MGTLEYKVNWGQVQPYGSRSRLKKEILPLLNAINYQNAVEFYTAYSIRILAADDNSINQKIALKMLERMGHHADAVGNGADALDAFREAPYDLILMACQMPEMDGYETTQIIHTSEALKLKDIKIIAMTANAIKASGKNA